MITILFIHQGAELYGSDKVLYNLVKGLDKSQFYPIVILPETGPLTHQLEREGIETHIAPVVKVSRKTYTLSGIISLPFEMVRSVKAIDRKINGRRIDIVHSNTLAVLAGAFWSKLRHVPHLWHVHEIIQSPFFASKVYPLLLRIFAQQVVCNSEATKKWVDGEQAVISDRTLVIWNGLEDRDPPSDDTVDFFRKEMEASPDDLIVTVVGRINRWKGHKLLIGAAGLLWEKGYRNIRYLFVGGVFQGQDHYQKELEKHISKSPVATQVTIMNFRDDIDVVWHASDIAVVPSTEPEPFGMVAIEAMMAAKPVIAANHGGLREIVVHQKTGLLFSPGDASALAEALIELIPNREKRQQMGLEGQRRQKQCFSVATQVGQLSLCYRKNVAG